MIIETSVSKRGGDFKIQASSRYIACSLIVYFWNKRHVIHLPIMELISAGWRSLGPAFMLTLWEITMKNQEMLLIRAGVKGAGVK